MSSVSFGFAVKAEAFTPTPPPQEGSFSCWQLQMCTHWRLRLWFFLLFFQKDNFWKYLYNVFSCHMKDIDSNLEVFPFTFMCIYSKYERIMYDKTKGRLMFNIQCWRFLHFGHFHSWMVKVVHRCLWELIPFTNYNDHCELD